MAMASSSGGNAQIDFNKLLYGEIDRTSEIAGDGPKTDADDAGNKHHCDGNDQGNSSAVEQARKNVSADSIGAEYMWSEQPLWWL